MLVAATVTGRPLQLGGARYNVGERVLLDPLNPQHRQVLDEGWVTRHDADIARPPAATAEALDRPPANKMIDAPQGKKTGRHGDRRHR